MEKQFKVSETFIRAAHRDANSEWREKLEDKYPEIFTPKHNYEVGDWIKLKRSNTVVQVVSIGESTEECAIRGWSADMWKEQEPFKGGHSAWSFGAKGDESWSKASANDIRKALIRGSEYLDIHYYNVTDSEYKIETGRIDKEEWFYDSENDVLHSAPEDESGSIVWSSISGWSKASFGLTGETLMDIAKKTVEFNTSKSNK